MYKTCAKFDIVFASVNQTYKMRDFVIFLSETIDYKLYF